MNANGLTEKLHAIADRKLEAFCEARFGDLFNICGGHSQMARPDLAEFPEVINALNQAGAKKDQFPWHGAVWELGKTVMFAMLRDKWREKEVDEFISKVESMRSELDTIYMKGGEA